MKRLLIPCLIYISIICNTHCKSDRNSNANTKPVLKSSYDTIVDYFSSRQKVDFFKAYKKLFVLTENGCMSCNKNLLNLVKQNLMDTNSAFLIGTNGAYLDISGFDTFRNVFIDQSLMETDYNIFHNSKVIFFIENNIDTIVNISAIGIQNQFDIIQRKK